MALPRVTLGRTGIQVSALCIGTGTNGWGGRSSQTALGRKGLPDLLEYAFQAGITFWDSADQYGSHPHVRDGLQRVGREHVVITTKTRARTAADCRTDLERFRRELSVDCIDIVLMHCLFDPEWPAQYAPVMDVLSEAKQSGKVRAVGVSCHNFGAFQRAADEPWVDVVLARLNYGNVNMDASWPEVVEVLHQMREGGKGVYGMKVLGAGKLTQDPERAIRFVFEQRAVDAITIGMRSRAEVDENCTLVRRALTELPAELAGTL